MGLDLAIEGEKKKNTWVSHCKGRCSYLWESRVQHREQKSSTDHAHRESGLDPTNCLLGVRETLGKSSNLSVLPPFSAEPKGMTVPPSKDLWHLDEGWMGHCSFYGIGKSKIVQ